MFIDNEKVSWVKESPALTTREELKKMQLEKNGQKKRAWAANP